MLNPDEPMAVVKISYGDVLLNADDAYALFKIMCKAQIVEYDWASQGYRRKKVDSDGNASLKAFSPVDYAALTLNSTD